MKKGCFLTGLFLLTIILAGVFYAVKNHSESLLNMAKPLLVQPMQNEIEEKISSLHLGSRRDTLQAIVSRYFSYLEQSDTLDLKRAGDFIDGINDAIRDSAIDSLEINDLTNLLNRHKNFYNERSKKN